MSQDTVKTVKFSDFYGVLNSRIGHLSLKPSFKKGFEMRKVMIVCGIAFVAFLVAKCSASAGESRVESRAKHVLEEVNKLPPHLLLRGGVIPRVITKAHPRDSLGGYLRAAREDMLLYNYCIHVFVTGRNAKEQCLIALDGTEGLGVSTAVIQTTAAARDKLLGLVQWHLRDPKRFSLEYQKAKPDIVTAVHGLFPDQQAEFKKMLARTVEAFELYQHGKYARRLYDTYLVKELELRANRTDATSAAFSQAEMALHTHVSDTLMEPFLFAAWVDSQGGDALVDAYLAAMRDLLQELKML